MTVNCRVDNGFCWCDPSTDKTTLEKINKCLSFIVPGREHMPLFKSGKWDGVKHFFNWRAKHFRVGLMDFVSRQTGVDFQVDSTDIDDTVMSYHAVTDGKHQLRDYQEKTVRDMLDARGGVASLATNAGKTACIAGIIKAGRAIGKKCVVLEGRKDLLDQVKKEIELWSGLKLGHVKASDTKLTDNMIIMIQTVYGVIKRINKEEAKGNDYDIYNALCEADIWLVDECHHCTSPSYMEIMDLNRKAWRFGFSGTVPDDRTIEGVEVRSVMGEVVTRVSNAYLIDNEISAKPTILMVEYVTENLEEKASVFSAQIKGACMKPIFQGTDAKGEAIMKFGFSVPTYTAKMREFVQNYSIKQNKQFWVIIESLLKTYHGMPTVIIVDWIDFGEELGRFLGVDVLHGQLSMPERSRILTAFRDGKIDVLIVTSILDEGISIDRIKVIILATMGSSIRQFLQRVGRGLRKKEGDNTLLIVDFIRFGHKYLLEPSKKRLALWKSEGFNIIFGE